MSTRGGERAIKRLLSIEVALVVAGVLFSVVLFLLVDVLVLSRFMTDEDEAGIHLHGERGWYGLKPHLRNISSAWGSAVYPVSTDALGHRIDPSRAPTRPAEFIFLGDSFTFGVNGPWDETFVGMFEQTSGRPVINAGVASYSPTPYLHHYKTVLAAGALRKPHTVVVAIDISDVQDEAAIWQDGDTTPTRYAGTYSKPSRVRQAITSNFLATRRIYRFIRRPPPSSDGTAPNGFVHDQRRSAFTWRRWDEITTRSPGDVGAYGSPQFFDHWGYVPLGVQGGLDRIAAKFRQMADVATAHQGRLWILIYPWPAQLTHPSAVFDWEAFHRDLCTRIACRGVINMFPIFRAQVESDPEWYRRLFVVGDTHFSKAGNRLIADELWRVLQSQPSRP